MSDMKFNYLYGMPIYKSPLLPEYEYVEPEKNWVDKVLEWNPCNLKKPLIKVKSNQIYIVNGAIFGSPSSIGSIINITA